MILSVDGRTSHVLGMDAGRDSSRGLPSPSRDERRIIRSTLQRAPGEAGLEGGAMCSAAPGYGLPDLGNRINSIRNHRTTN